jgi:hypothetical protein
MKTSVLKLDLSLTNPKTYTIQILTSFEPFMHFQGQKFG